MSEKFDLNAFAAQEKLRINKYYQTNKAKLVGFKSNQRFSDWYLNELNCHDFSCHYCGIKIFDLRNLILSGLIRGRKVSNDGIRGLNFEIDRKNPFEEYNENNCVLSCYYCNNDKSNTFDYEIYKETFGLARKVAWDKLLISFKERNSA